MSPGVRLRDGIEIELAAGDRIRLDGAGEARARALSHAHADHLFDPAGAATICSPLTAALARVRRGDGGTDRAQPPAWIELFNAGHIAGSRAVRITDPDTGRRYLYTGDICTRDRLYLEGFDPPDADVLVIEATYGKPSYRFPPTEDVLARITAWLEETRDRIALLFGYPLGRAQKLQRIAMRSARSRIFVTDSIERLNAVIERHLDVDFASEPYDEPSALEPGDVLVLPSQTSRLDFARRLAERDDTVTAGFSGWAVDRSFTHRGPFDVTFPLSDHCDCSELLEVVRAVDPERVYAHHGFADTFADIVPARCGCEARSLKRNQTTLADF